MEGTKSIPAFSDAGGTSVPAVSTLAAKASSAGRICTGSATQGIGRTNQASAPLFCPATTDVKSERRFISSIASRLDALCAMRSPAGSRAVFVHSGSYPHELK